MARPLLLIDVQRRVPALALALAAAGTMPAGVAALAPAPAAATQFAVAYAGSGTYRTVFRSEPPNPGGMHDTNSAHDSGTQRWSLRFTTPLRLPGCTRRSCAQTIDLTAATGSTAVTGRIAHVHVDGLYPSLNASVRCRIRYATPATAKLHADIRVRYLPAAGVVAITALSPVDDALTLLPPACPGQTDTIDGLFSSFVGPGFSFATGYGADRWFTSATVRVPLSRLRAISRLRISLSQTRQGTPPRGCSVPAPRYESCLTGGKWSGVLTLTARR